MNTVLLNIKACPLNHYTNQKTIQVDKVASFCSPWTFTYAETSPLHPIPGIHMATWHVKKIFTQVKQQLSSTILLHLWNRRRAEILARTAVSDHENVHYTNPEEAIHKAVFDKHPPELFNMAALPLLL